MKHLVRFTEDTNISRVLSAPAILELFDRSRSYLDELKKKEKIVDYGFFGVGRGAYVVFSVASTAELHTLAELVPMRPICAIDCQPVLEAGELSDAFGQVRREVTAAWERQNRLPVDSPMRY